MYLERINTSADLKKIGAGEYHKLTAEIRKTLIETVSVTGGHLASNLGAVELTVALHLAFDLPKDKIIWDVGHQAYIHKLLTGRREDFSSLRQRDGISGFPKRRESIYDSFDTGHSSTSISAAIGMARARDLQNKQFGVAAVIGDGALSGGMAYEALNNAADLKSSLVIILNDNQMSISESTGGISAYLSDIRTSAVYNTLKEDVSYHLSKVPVIGGSMVSGISKTKKSLKQLMLPGMIFEDLGITYIGPIEGHNILKMVKVFKEARSMERPILVHVLTQKGRGYKPAEQRPEIYHGIDSFDIKTGQPVKTGNPTYTDVFSQALLSIADKDKKVVAITAAMPHGTGLKRFSKKYPYRFFDVGIAEEHGVTFAAGMAAEGLKPVVAIYSTFLQRAYDQIFHDVCLQQLPVTFAIDRAGIVGNDGETHQGNLDISYLRSIPGMTIFAPKNAQELMMIMNFSLTFNRPLAIRYPKGEAWLEMKDNCIPIEYGKSETLYQGKTVALLAAGSMVKTAVMVRDKLIKDGLDPTVVNIRFIKPLDEETIVSVAQAHSLLVTMEENTMCGGLSEAILYCMNNHKCRAQVLTIAIPDKFIEQGNQEAIKEDIGLDAESIVNKIKIYLGLKV